MDARNRNGYDGRTICPNCNCEFFPELGERKQPDVAIQNEFPNATPAQREQLITGICSDKCWKQYLGGE